MKLTYSIAILLSVTFVQCISAASNTEKSEAMVFKRREITHDSRSALVATALRRRGKSFSPTMVRRYNEDYFYQPSTGAASSSNLQTQVSPNTGATSRPNNMNNNGRLAPGPVNTVDSTLSKISATIKLLLASDDESSDGGKEEKNNNHEDRDDKRAKKELIKMVKELGKMINKFLKEAGVTSTLDLDDILKAAEKDRLYSPLTQNKRALEEQEKSGVSHAKLAAAAQKVTLAADQVVGFSAQLEDENAKAGAQLNIWINLLINLVLQQNP